MEKKRKEGKYVFIGLEDPFVFQRKWVGGQDSGIFVTWETERFSILDLKISFNEI